MSEVTLKTHMILSDGIHYRGAVIDSKLVPDHLYNSKYVVEGRKHISRVLADDEVELEEARGEDIYPMKELTLAELAASEPQPRKLIRRR